MPRSCFGDCKVSGQKVSLFTRMTRNFHVSLVRLCQGVAIGVGLIRAVVARSLGGFGGEDGDAPEGGRFRGRASGPEIETIFSIKRHSRLPDWVKCHMRNLAQRDEDNLRDEM